MKIGFDGRYAEGDLVGVGKYINSLINQIAKKNVECVIFYSKKPKATLEGKNISSKILPSINRYTFEQISLPRALKQERVDIYHALGNLGIPLVSPVPSILTVHDIIPLMFPDYFKYSKYGFLTKFSYLFRLKSSVARAKKIIADSEYTKKTLIEETGVRSGKVVVVYLGVPEVNQETNKLPKGLKLGEYILNHGGIDIRKNLERLIRAFAKVLKTKDLHAQASLKLVITGENMRIEEELRKETEILGISNKVIFPGYVDEERLWSLIRQASCVCYPSLIEGFGGPVLEGFAGGVPVITSNVSSLPEIAGGAAYLVNPENEEEIAEAIMKVTRDKQSLMLRNKETSNRLIRKGKERVKQFSWEKTAEEVIRIYKETSNK